MGHPLDDAWRKFDWAKRHYRALCNDVGDFEREHPYRISVALEEDNSAVVFRVHDLAEPPADWGLRIGDILHNARTALDYLVVQLAAMTTGQQPGDVASVQFPIYSDAKKFKDNAKRGLEEVLPHGYFTRLEELQPFHAMDTSIWPINPLEWSQVGVANFGVHRLPFALETLADLDNIDKHRVVVPMWHRSAWHRSGSVEIPVPPHLGHYNRWHHKSAMTEGSEIGRWGSFHKPVDRLDWEPEQQLLREAFPLEVTIDHPATEDFPAVPQVLAFALWAAEAVLKMFGPVFRREAATMPVGIRLLPPDAVSSVKPPDWLPG